MFQIGQTSGVGSSSAPSGTPIEDIKNYLTKMAKNASEIPKDWINRTNVVTVATGDDKVLESSTGAASSAEGGEGEEGEGATEKAGGACGRNRQAAAKKNISKTKDCAKSCSGSQQPDNDSPSIDPTTIVPSTAEEVTESSLADMQAASQMSAEEFKRNFCDKKPYAICTLCNLANSITTISEFDLLSMLKGITDALDALTIGNISLADNLFQCPGMTSDLLSNKLGPLGMVVGPCVAASMISMTAVCGAVKSFSSIANVYAHTDLLGTVRDSVGRLIGSGGITRSFTSKANELISNLNLTTKNLYTCTSSASRKNAYVASNARLMDVLLGRTASHELATLRANLLDMQLSRLWEQGKSATTYPSATRSAVSYSKGSSTSSGGSSASTTKPKVTITTDTTAKAGVTYSYKKTDSSSGVSGAGTASSGLSDADYVEIPADKTQPGASLEDLRAQYGDLFVKEDSSETSGTTSTSTYEAVTTYDPTITEYKVYDAATDKFVSVEAKSEEEFKKLVDEYGTVYVEHVTPPTPEPYNSTTDEKAQEDKTYYKVTEDGEYEAIPKEDLLIYTWEYKKLDDTWKSEVTYYRFIESTTEYVVSTDTSYRSDKKYYFRTGSGTRVDPYVYTLIAFEDLDPGTVYYECVYTPGRYEALSPQPTSQAELDAATAEYGVIYTATKTAVVDGKRIEAYEAESGVKVYEKAVHIDTTASTSGPIVLPDGSIMEKPVSTDGIALDEIVTTYSLVTRNHLPVSEMAKLYGIGLTVEELTMAYMLDHEINGSVLPRDVKGKVIPTILDTIVDDW